MSYKPRLNIDTLVFSLPDVVIDADPTYREVVCKAVQLYLEQAVGLISSPEPLLTVEEVKLLEKSGGFTSYTDLSTAFIIYFIEMLPPVPVPTFPSRLHVPSIIAYLQLAGGRLQISIDKLREQKDIPKLAQDIVRAGGDVDGADTALPKMNRHLLVDEGDILRANLLGRAFQELYLGAALFKEIYGQQAVVVQSGGYLDRNKLLIDPALLAELSHKMPLAVVGNCSQAELEHTLRANNIEQHFQVTISLQDVQEARARSLPEPWSLLEVTRRLEPAPAYSAYVGASIGDVRAAKAASREKPFTAVGCLFNAHEAEELRQKFEEEKADVILEHPDHLRELIFGG